MIEVQLKDGMSRLLAGEPATMLDPRESLARGRAARRARRAKVSAASVVAAVALLAIVPRGRELVVGERVHPSQRIGPFPGPTYSLPPRTSPYTGYPNSIAVIGFTTAMGRASIPADLAADASENSWATGSNPAVVSVYSRVLAHNPRISGHRSNLSTDAVLPYLTTSQVGQAVAMAPPPDLVLMQVLDYDINCPATTDDTNAARAGMLQALQTLHAGAPNTRIFVLSMFGSATTLPQAMTPDQRRTFGQATSDYGCTTVTPAGELIQPNIARFEQSTHAYEAAIKAACAQVPLCVWDDGAFGNAVERPEDIAPSFTNLTVAGQAHAADVAWTALQKAGLIPAG